ncbi:outer membrane lipoprotein chaperone LolA [Silanimonas sp.]|jgi:outer membrane lipoprotein carrier protein|uniref:outer membrane lipoprotein chaperone LolA n=1 Tax=Silanimonas sp. TaxID=1929290 RepID=UPI0037CA8741
MTTSTLFRTAIAALMLAPALASASAGREAITRFSTDLRSLDGRFAQQVFDANGTATDRSEGRISLKAPRQFRWEYQQPYPQLIVADGDHLWLYDPDLEQVTVRVQSYEEQSSPLAALIDPGELDRQFVVGEGGQADGLTWVDLKARKPEDSAVQAAKLGFNASGLARMVFEDQLGQRTEVSFSQWKRNGALPADLFRFTPPEGVDVVGETRDSAEVRPLQE